MTDAIIVENLQKRFGSVVALDGVGFAVPTGTVLGLLGPNGAGKTTSVRMLTTILRPDSGRAEVLGHRRHPQPAGGARAHRPRRAVRRGRREPHRPREPAHGRPAHPPVEARRRSTGPVELLERFALADAADRPVRTYSGGMRRRLDLAAALVHRPPVLFLDEPTTGLDPSGRQDLWGVIEGLVREGTTLLLTTQYLEEADRLADNIVVIDHGQVIAEGTSSELKATMGATIVEVGFADPATAQRARRPSSPASVCATSVPARPPSSSRSTTARGSCSTSSAPSTTRTSSRSRSTVREPTLDDVFLSLTGHKAEEPEPDDEPADSRPPPDPRCSMTATAIAIPTTIERPKHSAFGWAVQDAMTVTWRNLVAMKRTPQVLVFSTIQPIIFVLMFRYVFGGAIRIPGVDALRRLPDAGRVRADRRVRFDPDRRRPRRRPAQGPHRAVPVAADGALGGARRAARSPTSSATCSSSRLMVGRRVPRRLAHPHQRVRPDRRRRDDAAVRALAVVGVRARRPEGRATPRPRRPRRSRSSPRWCSRRRRSCRPRRCPGRCGGSPTTSRCRS